MKRRPEKGGTPWKRIFRPSWKRRCSKEFGRRFIFIFFFRMLKENAAREEKYQAMIDSLSTNIAEGIEDIQNRLDVFMTAHRNNPTTE